jgi:hypothetical protein
MPWPSPSTRTPSTPLHLDADSPVATGSLCTVASRPRPTGQGGAGRAQAAAELGPTLPGRVGQVEEPRAFAQLARHPRGTKDTCSDHLLPTSQRTHFNQAIIGGFQALDLVTDLSSHLLTRPVDEPEDDDATRALTRYLLRPDDNIYPIYINTIIYKYNILQIRLSHILCTRLKSKPRVLSFVGVP